jgi:hypothetical protein
VLSKNSPHTYQSPQEHHLQRAVAWHCLNPVWKRLLFLGARHHCRRLEIHHLLLLHRLHHDLEKKYEGRPRRENGQEGRRVSRLLAPVEQMFWEELELTPELI